MCLIGREGRQSEHRSTRAGVRGGRGGEEGGEMDCVYMRLIFCDVVSTMEERKGVGGINGGKKRVSVSIPALVKAMIERAFVISVGCSRDCTTRRQATPAPAGLIVENQCL